MQLDKELSSLLALTQNERRCFVGKSIYITGATGFIGAWLWEALIDVAAINTQWKDSAGCYHHIPGTYDYVFHCAPVDYPFDEIRAREGILFTSSGAAKLLTTPYADMKRRQEKELLRRCENVKIARIYTLVGPRQRLSSFAVTNFIHAALTGKPLEVFGDGPAIRTYLYIVDCIWWLLKIMLDGQGTYEVGAIEPITIKELAYKVAGMVEPLGDVKFIKPEFVDHAPRYVPDVTKTLALGLQETFTIDEALARTIQFTKDCPRVG